MSEVEREKQMDELRIQATMAKDLSVAIKAISALAGFGEEAIHKLETISDPSGLADNKVKAAANREIEKIKKRT